MPLHYVAAYRALVLEGADAGIFQVSPPDASGACSFGPTADAPPDMLARVGWKLGIVNRATPRVHSAPCAAIDAFDAILEVDHPLAELPAAPPGQVAATIAAQAAAFVRDGDIVQAGIGRLPLQTLAALRDRRDLRIHSGFVGDAHLGLIEAGAIADRPGAIVTGSILGSAELYGRFSAERRLVMTNVEGTHAHQKLASLPNLVALNAAVEVDLLGQVTSETARGVQMSGVGGLVDFLRGAHAAPGGRAIILLQAEGRHGESRVFPRLPDAVVTVPRTDAPILITEFGGADLRLLDTDARAEAIIGLAPPSAREDLRDHWAKARKRLLG
jgi:acyl-CoA hydrolase